MRSIKTASKLGIILALVCAQAIAQGPRVTVALESATVKPGHRADIKLSLAIPPGRQVAGLNWTLLYPETAIEDLVLTAGPAAHAAEKLLKCRSVAGGTKCLLFGLNKNTLAPGTLATVTFRVREGAAKSSIDLQLIDLVAASPLGLPIPCTASSGSITVRE
jgi:hypothetical protein